MAEHPDPEMHVSDPAVAEKPLPAFPVDPDLLGKQLFAEAESGYSKILEMLIEQGANVNITDEFGMTPLHYAAGRGARECVRVLVACGRCDYLIQDNEGRYAADLAFEWGRDRGVAELLDRKQTRQAFERGVPAYIPKG